VGARQSAFDLGIVRWKAFVVGEMAARRRLLGMILPRSDVVFTPFAARGKSREIQQTKASSFFRTLEAAAAS